jgi:hypothetical protein
MRRRCLLATALLALALAPAAGAACTPAWRSLAPPSPGTYNNFFGGVAALSPDDAWAVGESDDLGPLHTLAAHWNGTGWTVVPTPNPGTGGVLDGAAAVAPDDVWAVGYFFVDGNFNPLTIHWDGTAWSVVPNPGAPGQYLLAVDAIATDDVWATGPAGAMHWDGTAWTAFPDGGGSDIDGAAANDVWTAAEPVRRFDGTSFTTPPQPPAVGTLYDVRSGIASPARGDAWIAGSSVDAVDVDDPDPSRTAVAHFSGGAWTVTPTPNLGRANNSLNDIDFGTRADGWTVGTADQARALLIERWTRGRWELFEGDTPPATSAGSQASELLAVDARPDGTAFTVGYTNRARGTETLAQRICPVKVGAGGFDPRVASTNSRRPVAWTARGAGHTVTDATGLGLFDSGPLADGAGFTFRPPAAAGYRTRDKATGRTGTLAVPLNITPLSGGAYRVGWAGALPAGLVVEVQLQEPRDPGFETFRTGTRTGGADFTPRRGPGTYRFRSRLRRPGGPTTDWSPVKSLVLR